MSSTNKTNEALRYQRLMRGWSLQRTADGIVELSLKQDGKRPGVNGDMVGEWERGVKVPSPFYREKLCLLYRATAEQLDLMNAPVPQLAHTYQLTSALTGKEDMIMKRRELLRLLSLAGAALILPLPDIVDWERIEGVLVRPSRLDEKLLRDLEAMNYHYWSIYRASSSKRVVLDGVLKQLKIMVGLLRGSHAALLHKWLCALVSDLGQLAGEVFFDANDYDAAQSCYTFAATAAKEGEHYDLWSCALIRHAFLPVYDEQFHDALPLLQEAQRLFGKTPVFVWVFQARRSSWDVHPGRDAGVIAGNVCLAFFRRHLGEHLLTAALQVLPVSRLLRGWMLIRKYAIAAEHVA